MSTRCTLTARDARGSHTLYRHSDGYPTTEHGVLNTLRLAFPYAWPLPRFEADDFAAAIVAAWKAPASPDNGPYARQGGNIRMCSGRNRISNTEYHYDITLAKGGKAVHVKVSQRDDDDAWVPVSAHLVSPEGVKDVALSKADAKRAALLAA